MYNAFTEANGPRLPPHTACKVCRATRVSGAQPLTPGGNIKWATTNPHASQPVGHRSVGLPPLASGFGCTASLSALFSAHSITGDAGAWEGDSAEGVSAGGFPVPPRAGSAASGTEGNASSPAQSFSLAACAFSPASSTDSADMVEALDIAPRAFASGETSVFSASSTPCSGSAPGAGTWDADFAAWASQKAANCALMSP